MRTAVASAAALALTLIAGVAGAQTAAPSSAPRTPTPSTAARAARDATVQAKEITYDLMRNGTRIGSVALYPIGRTQSRVRVTFTNPADDPLRLALIPGSACTSGAAVAAANAIPLNPVNNSTQISETIVNVPLTNLQGNYLVQAHNATQRAQIAEACARLRR
ncbi:MAG TPA: hypothetical protein VFB22_15585 [Candidatus Baltobacteraceae bacterium]|nr:hypothetical protein [Candidatus Baltobacteraceae bacterium]